MTPTEALVTAARRYCKDNYSYLDGNNTYGLSGSPIFAINPMSKRWRMIGMVTSYYKQTDHVFNSETGLTEEREENSGIVKGIHVVQIIELIHRAQQ